MNSTKQSDSEIMEKLLSSEVKLEILILFHSNPGLIDKKEAIARRIGRNPASLEDALKDLVDLGVLIKKDWGKAEIFFFDQPRDSEIQRILSNRLLTVTHIA
jgi:predicted transcriptional regulator